ncbi:hypothetical protein N0V84_010929 [Fusarium piperis]|uniref:Uncharacterized protein n=1 Tax=Fusarium piperis TaxID=1435070 RepID=A0A9W8W3W1_9HYPO|nr:hypothetical protein N0V84_010929 [Fusarium piperis]
MQGFLLLGAAAVGLANAAAVEFPKRNYYNVPGNGNGYNNIPEGYTTSTVYETQTFTVTDCHDDVPDCPNTPHVTTKTIAVSTTICPITEVETPPGPVSEASTSYVPPQPTSSTIPYGPPPVETKPTTSSAPPAETQPSSSVPPVGSESSSVPPVDTTHYGPPPSETKPTSSAPETLPSQETTPYAPPPSETKPTSSAPETQPSKETTPYAPPPAGSTEVSSSVPSVETESTSVPPVETESTSVPPVETKPTTTTKKSTTPYGPPPSETLPATSEGTTELTTSTPKPLTTGWTTSTVYTTEVHTVTSCPPEVPDCPGTPHVTTKTIAVSTTICPVTETQPVPTGQGSTDYPPPPVKTTTQPGVSTEEIPSSSEEVPSSSEGVPTTSEGVPTTTGKYPPPPKSSTKPGVSTKEVSTSSEEVPTSSEGVPTTSGNYPPPPKSSTKPGHSTEEVPTSSEEVPTSSEEVPSTTGKTPSSTGKYPPPPKTTGWTTSTVYTTNVYTITSCPPEVPDCPNTPHVTTETIAVSTTICPVTSETVTGTTGIETIPQGSDTKSTWYEDTTTDVETAPTTTGTEIIPTTKTTTKLTTQGHSTTEWTTSTVYTTNVYTITSCPPEVPDCPGTPHVTTETIAVSTTVCPVTSTTEVPPQSTKPGSTNTQPTQQGSTESVPTTLITSTPGVPTTPVPTGHNDTTAYPPPPVPSSSKGTTEVPPPKPTTKTGTTELPPKPSTTEWTTSTVYTTTVKTITNCGPDVPYCSQPPHVTTETIAVSTTVCPVTSTEEVPPPQSTKPTANTEVPPPKTTTKHEDTTEVPPPKGTTEVPPPKPVTTTGWSTSTVYTTTVRTITYCGPDVPYCSQPPHVTTETVALSTTICPVTSTYVPPKPTSNTEAPPPKGTTEVPPPKDTTEVPPPKPVTTTGWSTSTIYTTTVKTITYCGPDVPYCSQPPHVTTETVALSTTICPVTSTYVPPKPTANTEVPPPKPTGHTEVTPPKPTEPVRVETTTHLTTSTVYTTNVRTVTWCAPGVPDCPNTPHVTTETIALSTTICPVTITRQVTPPPYQTTKVVVPPQPHTTKVVYPPNPPLPGNYTQTLYTTKHYTITKCPPEVPDCPIGKVTTTIYATATTCIQSWHPTTKVTQSTAVVPPPHGGNLTSTLYTTKHYTISKCHPEAQDCTVGKPTTVVYATGTTKITQPSAETHYTVPETETVVPTKPVETEPVETKPVETKPAETQPAVSYSAPQPAETKPSYEQPSYEQPEQSQAVKPAESQTAQTYSTPNQPDGSYPAPLAATTEETDDGVEEKTVPVTGAAGRLMGNVEVVLAAAGVVALLL